MDDFIMKKEDTEEGEKDQGGERSDDTSSAETETESMPTSSASASVEDLGQSKS